jgi:hypothetical protein
VKRVEQIMQIVEMLRQMCIQRTAQVGEWRQTVLLLYRWLGDGAADMTYDSCRNMLMPSLT